jgi:hypothetical protein
MFRIASLKMAPKATNEELDMSPEKEEEGGPAGSWAEGLAKGTATVLRIRWDFNRDSADFHTGSTITGLAVKAKLGKYCSYKIVLRGFILAQPLSLFNCR